MKKISTAALSLGLLTVGGLILTQTAHADSSESTIVNVSVTAGDLTIKNLTNIEFGTHTITGEDINLSSDNAFVDIEDLRGSNSKGWTLTAKLQEGDFNGMGLTFNPEVTANNTVVQATATGNLNTEEQLIASVHDADISNSEFDTSLDLNAKLEIPAKTKAATYTTTVVWNLAATPETK